MREPFLGWRSTRKPERSSCCGKGSAHLLGGTRLLGFKRLHCFTFWCLMVGCSTLPPHTSPATKTNSSLFHKQYKAMLPLLVRRALYRGNVGATRVLSTWRPPKQQQAGAKKKLPAFLSDPATYPLIGIVGSVRVGWVDMFVCLAKAGVFQALLDSY